MTTEGVGGCIARVFLKADHEPFRGEDLWRELIQAGLSYREAKAVPGRIQRGELSDYGFAKKGKQRTVYFENEHADKLERGYLPQPFLGADLAKGRWTPVAAIYHTPGGPDAFELKRLVDEARQMVLSRQPRRFLGLLKPRLDVAEFDRVFRELNPQVYQTLKESCKAYYSDAWSVVELDGGAYLIPMTLTPLDGAPPVPGGFVLLSS